MKAHRFTITLVLALFVSRITGTQAQAPNFKGFPDVPKNHWAYQAVTDLARRGILQGYPAEGGGDKLKAKPAAQTNAPINTKTASKRTTKGNSAR